MTLPTVRRASAAARALRLTPIALAAALASQPALSAVRTWTGGAGPASTFWDLATNWDTGLPVAGDTTVMGAFNTTIRSGAWQLLSTTGTGTLTMAAGSATVTDPSTVGSLAMSGGELGGSGTWTAGTFNWTGGSLGRSTSTGGTLDVNGAATLNNAQHTVNYGQTLNLKGNSTWGPYGQFYTYGAGGGYGASTVNISAGRTFTLQGDDTAGNYYQIYGPGVFNNNGTVTKTGANRLYIDGIFNNLGTLNVNGGETFLRNTRTLGGTVNVATGATLHFDGTTLFNPTVAINGNGNVIFDGQSNVLASGTLTIGGAGTKTLANGSLGGAGTMVFNNLTWLNGTMGNSTSTGGVTTVNGPTTLSSATKYVNYGRTLNLNGDTTWDADGALYIYGAGGGYGASVVNLAAGATMTMPGNAWSYDQLYGPGTFNNAGTITRNGTGIFYIDSGFDNTGTININAGELQFRQTRTVGGTVNVAASGTVRFNGVTTFAAGLAIAGNGSVIFDGTSNVLPSGNLNIGGTGAKTMQGTMGGAGTITLSNLNWLSGNLGVSSSPGGTLTVTGTTILSTASRQVNYGQTLNLGDTVWDADGNLNIGGAGAGYGASAVNLGASKTLTMAGNAYNYDMINGAGTFNNAGTIAKTGIGILYIDSGFNNTGAVNADAGEVQFRQTRTLGGTFNIGPNAVLNFSGMTTFAPGLTISGNGAVTFAGSYNVLPSGTLVIAGTGVKTLTSGAALGGAGALTLSNLTWLSGRFGYSGSVGGSTTVTGTTFLSGTTHSVEYGHTLNLGNTVWGANGRLDINGAGAGYGASTVNLAAGRTLTMAGNAYNNDYIYGSGTFNNAGTINKSGAGILYIQSGLNNTGTLNVTNGEVQFQNARTLGGTVTVGPNALMRFNGSTTFDPAMVLTGAGRLVFDGSYNIQTSGTRTFGGGGIKTLSGGALGGAGTMVFDNLVWSGGSMGYSGSVGGTTTVTGLTTLSSAGHNLNYGHTLNLNGNVIWGANGRLYMYGAGAGYGESVVNLAAGRTMTLAGNPAPNNYDQIYGEGTFNNAGTITKTSTNTLYIDSNLNNSGTVNGNNGLILIRDTLNNTGTLAANGGRVEVTNGTLFTQWTLATQRLAGGTYRVTGSQPIAFALGNVPGTSTPAQIKTSAARIFLSGPGAAILTTTPDPDTSALAGLTTNTGTLSVTGGATLRTAALKNNGSGSVIVGPGSTLTIGGATYRQAGAGARTFVGGTLSTKAFFFDTGFLSAGVAADQIGSGVIAGMTGLMTFGALATLSQDVGVGSWDTLTVPVGNVVLGGTLATRFDAGAGAGTYRFLTTTAGTIAGTFAGVTSNLDPGLFSVAPVYGSNFVDLQVTAIAPAPAGGPGHAVTAVPEPGTWALMGAGVGLLGWLARRRGAARAPKRGAV